MPKYNEDMISLSTKVIIHIAKTKNQNPSTDQLIEAICLHKNSMAYFLLQSSGLAVEVQGEIPDREDKVWKEHQINDFSKVKLTPPT